MVLLQNGFPFYICSHELCHLGGSLKDCFDPKPGRKIIQFDTTYCMFQAALPPSSLVFLWKLPLGIVSFTKRWDPDVVDPDRPTSTFHIISWPF